MVMDQQADFPTQTAKPVEYLDRGNSIVPLRLVPPQPLMTVLGEKCRPP
jgi:hypothetical protein